MSLVLPDVSTPARGKSWRWWVCGLLLLATMINYMDRLVLNQTASRLMSDVGFDEAGYGGLSNPGDGGLAWLLGGGLMIHFGGAFSLGAEVNYAGITGTGFEVLSIGPTLIIGG